MAAAVIDRAQYDQTARDLRDRLVAAIHANISQAVREAASTVELNQPITDGLVHHVAHDTLRPWLTRHDGTL